MKLPAASAGAVARFEEIARSEPRLEVRRMFGQPSAFLSGHFCLGTFGGELVLRLGPKGADEAGRLPGAHPFSPMAGRSMAGYIALPPAIFEDPTALRPWVERAIRFVGDLPPKERRPGRGRPRSNAR